MQPLIIRQTTGFDREWPLRYILNLKTQSTEIDYNVTVLVLLYMDYLKRDAKETINTGYFVGTEVEERYNFH